MPRTACVKFPMADLLKKLGLPKNTKILGAATRYEGRLTLTLEHPDLIDHDGMNPPFVDPDFGRGQDEFRWNQKPPVLMGEDGVARKRELAKRRKRLESGHQPQADGPVDSATLKRPRGGSAIKRS